MNDLEQALWAAGGSVAVEIVAVLKHFNSDAELPARYKKPGYWIARLALVVVAGFLGVAYDVDKPIVAVHVGASAPLIVRTFVTSVPKNPDSAAEGEGSALP